MKTSQSADLVFPAFVKACSALSDLKKDTENKFGGYRYATLDQLLGMTRPIFANEGCMVMQDFDGTGAGSTVAIVTRIVHSSGQWIESEPLVLAVEPRKGLTDAQATGSTITYGRRYSLSAFVGITAEEDTDAAARPETPRQQTARTREEAVREASRAFQAPPGRATGTKVPPGSGTPETPKYDERNPPF